MSGSWAGGPTAGVDLGSDAFTKLINGVEAALSSFYGATDPSTGSWGSGQLGYRWISTDPALGHSDSNPAVYRWEQTDSVGPTYGWVLLGLLGWRRHDTPANRALSFSPASPATANVAWSDHSFASQLDTERTAQGISTDKLAYAAKLRIRVEAADTIPTGASNETKGYFAIRRKGDTGDGARIYAQVADRALEQEVVVFLDSAETAQFAVQVEDGASPSFKYEAWVEAWMEMV